MDKLLGHGAISFYHDYMANNEFFHNLFGPMFVGQELTDTHNVYLHFLYQYGALSLLSVLFFIFYRLKSMTNNGTLFYKMKFTSIMVAMIAGIFLMSYNFTMGLIPILF